MPKKRKVTGRGSFLEISGDSESERPREQMTQDPTSGVESKRSACVFAKRYPSNTAVDRVCLRPGFATVARLKEHLYRKHQKPIHCLRCFNIYATESELQDHQDAPARCPKADSSREIVGIDAGQIKDLKRKARRKDISEEDRWRDVFKIVFPKADKLSIPSPYCEAGARFRHLTQLEDLFRIRTISETERMLSANFNQVPVELTRQLPRMVLSIVENIFMEFRLHEEPETTCRASQYSQAETEVRIISEGPLNETCASDLSAAVNERQEITQNTASKESSVPETCHSEAARRIVGQNGPSFGPHVPSDLDTLATSETWNVSTPALHHTGPDGPFASLEFAGLGNLQADQFVFGFDEYLGLFGEDSSQQSNGDCQR